VGDCSLSVRAAHPRVEDKVMWNVACDVMSEGALIVVIIGIAIFWVATSERNL